MNRQQLQDEYTLAANALHDAAAEVELGASALENAKTDAERVEFTKRLDVAEVTFKKREKDAADALDRLERFDALAAARTVTLPDSSSARVLSEPLTYERGSPHSVFSDMVRSSRGDFDAAERLQRHTSEMRIERPGAASFDLSSTDSAGGYLVAPLYLQEEFITASRAGAATVNAIGTQPLPPNTDTIHIPAMATGTAVALQSGDNAAIQETDATFGTKQADVKTIAGMQDVSRQVVDRGVPGTDEVIFGDLAADFFKKWDIQVLTSSTANFEGLLEVDSGVLVTYTDASPTLAELYPKLADAVGQIHAGVFGPATAIVVAPRRWAWMLAALDTTNRPLIVPVAQAPQNAAGVSAGAIAEGMVGSLMGIPIYVDANLPLTLGGGTEDVILVLRTPELRIWADPAGPYLERFDDIGSGTLTVRFRLHNYVAQQFERRPLAVGTITGTGLVL